MKFLEARNQHRDTGTPLQMYGRAPLFHIHRAYIIYGEVSRSLALPAPKLCTKKLALPEFRWLQSDSSISNYRIHYLFFYGFDVILMKTDCLLP